MLASTDPREAYRRTAFDARVQAGDPAALVHLCLEQAITAIGGALFAHARNDTPGRSKSLTRALTAITALELGVDSNGPLAKALFQVYRAARMAVLDSATTFDPEALGLVRQDFLEIDAALRQVAIDTDNGSGRGA